MGLGLATDPQAVMSAYNLNKWLLIALKRQIITYKRPFSFPNKPLKGIIPNEFGTIY